MIRHPPSPCCPATRGSQLHRRDLSKLAGGAGAAGLAFAGLGAHAASPRKTDLTADQALQLLREGNEIRDGQPGHGGAGP